MDQFGHNDQKSTSGVTMDMYKANLKKFAEEVKSAGGTPVSQDYRILAKYKTHRNRSFSHHSPVAISTGIATKSLKT